MDQFNFSLIPAKIFRKDLNGRFIFANAKCIRAFGRARIEEVLGTTDFNYYEPEQAHNWRLQEQEMIATHTDMLDRIEQELWIDREPTWTQTSKLLEYDSHGKPVAIFGFSYDISAIYTQLLRYQEAVEGHRDGVWQLDARTGDLWLSRRCIEILGQSVDTVWNEMSARRVLDFVHPDDHDRVKTLYLTISREQTSRELDCRIVRPDDSVVPIRLRLTASFSNHFQFPSKLYGSITDRTDSVLQDSYRAFLDLVPSYIFVKDRQFRFTFVNEALADGFGIPAREIIGKTDAELNPNAKQVASFQNDDEEVLRFGKPKSIPEETFDHKHFGRRVLKTIKVPLPGDQPGTSCGLVGVSTDVTELWEVRKFLETLMEHVPDNVFFKNVKHEFIRINAAMADNLGANLSEVIGKTDFDFYPSDEAKAWRMEEERIFQSGISVKGDIRQTSPLRRETQDPQWRSVSKLPVYDPNGSVVGLVGIAHNLTEERNSRLLLSTVLDQIPLLIALQDTAGKYLLCNRAFADHVKVSSSEIIGKPANVLPDAEALGRLAPHFDAALSGTKYHNDSHEERDSAHVTRYFALTMAPVFASGNGSPQVSSVLTIRDELSHIVSRQKSLHHAQLEILDLLRNEEVTLRQHYLLLLSLTHALSFGFNRAISWTYNVACPNEIRYVHCIGQLNRDDAVRFKAEFPDLEKWTFEQCIQDFENLSDSRDGALAHRMRLHQITVGETTELGAAIATALKTNSIMIEVWQSTDDFASELRAALHDCGIRECLVAFIPLEGIECIIVVCDNIRTDRPIETAVDDAGRSQSSEINDFLKSAQANIVAATRHAAERARLSREEAGRQVAHNISHMLGNILPYTLDALDRVQSKLSTKKDRDIDAIGKDLLRAMDLVEDFRRYSQSIDQWELSREVVNVRDFAETIRDYLLGSIPGLVLNVDPAAGEAAIDVDVNSLRQDCFAQLATNAVSHSGREEELYCKLMVNEYTSSREIGLGQRRITRWVEFVFADNGKGVPHEIKKKIFEPMYSTSPRGTGLGLPIANRIVELHGGVIREVGVPGLGAEFRIRLSVVDV